MRSATRPLGALLREFRTFAGIGAIGFSIDVLVFLFMTHILCWTTAGARILSASLSITATWALNRTFTFAQRKSERKSLEYIRYVATQALGLGINVGVFVLFLWAVPMSRELPIVALLAGATTALAFNFVSARSFAFRPQSRATHEKTNASRSPALPDNNDSFRD